MKLKNKGYLIILSLFLIYMFSANYIFTGLIKVDNESFRVFFKLPEPTQVIKMNIDNIDEMAIKWKDIISIEGWAFKISQKDEIINRYIVLQSENAYYVFDINAYTIKRVDVAECFNLDNFFTGFKALIAKDNIKEGIYRLGIIIEDNAGKHFLLSNQYLTKENNRIISGFLSTKMEITTKESELAVKYSIDSFEDQDGVIRIRGWGFIEGLDTNNIKHYILFKKGDEFEVFDTATQTRKDVTDHFKDYGLDLDNSGFEAVIPRDMLTSSEYQLGLYIVIGNQQGVILLDTYINNNAEDLK